LPHAHGARHTSPSVHSFVGALVGNQRLASTVAPSSLPIGASAGTASWSASASRVPTVHRATPRAQLPRARAPGGPPLRRRPRLRAGTVRSSGQGHRRRPQSGSPSLDPSEHGARGGRRGGDASTVLVARPRSTAARICREEAANGTFP
jgi:hypothetical protein